MIENSIGGANTKTGLIFEGQTDLKTFLNLHFFKNNTIL